LTFAFTAGFSERVILRFIPIIKTALGSPTSPAQREHRGNDPKERLRVDTFRADVGLMVLDPAGKGVLLASW